MASVDPRRSGNPAVRASSGASTKQAAEPSPLRAAVNARSRPFLATLARLPRIVVSALVVLLMVAGLSGPPAIALSAFAVLAVFIGWLAYLAWPTLDFRGKLIRALMLALVLVTAGVQVGGLF